VYGGEQLPRETGCERLPADARWIASAAAGAGMFARGSVESFHASERNTSQSRIDVRATIAGGI